MCERESRFSGSRAKIRQLELELSASKEENEILRLRCRNLEDNTSKLDKENAQLRCKNWSLKENLQPNDGNSSKSNVTASKTPCLSNNSVTKSTGTAKSVRFLLPDEAPLFQRTEDRCVQTADPAETATQTSILVDTPRAIPSKVTFDPRVSCYSVLSDRNQVLYTVLCTVSLVKLLVVFCNCRKL